MHEGSKFAVFMNLESAAEGANRAFGGMGTKPGGVTPHNLAIGASADLAVTDGELDVPHVRGHLPEDEPAGLHDAR